MVLMNKQIFKDAQGGLMLGQFLWPTTVFPQFGIFFVDTDRRTDMLDPGKSLLTRCVSTETLNAFEKVLHCFMTLQ